MYSFIIKYIKQSVALLIHVSRQAKGDFLGE